MAFGKRSAGDTSRPVPSETPAAVDTDAAPTLAVRTRVANHGEIDRNFIALAVGVVIVSAGGAIAAPSLFTALNGGVRPIAQIVAGLDRTGMELALAREAFPDASGAAFMTRLAASFPEDHERLIDRLTDAAAAGGDRDDLFAATSAWTMEFVVAQLPAVSRSGAEGFDRAVSIASDGLRVLETKLHACTPAAMKSLVANPDSFDSLVAYNGDGYHLSMRANQALVDLAAIGRTASPVDTRLTADDINALKSTFFSFMMDEQVMKVAQTAMSASGSGMADFEDLNVNLCQLGRTLMLKLDSLPDATKARLWANVTSGDPRGLMSMEGLSAVPDIASGFSSGSRAFAP